MSFRSSDNGIGLDLFADAAGNDVLTTALETDARKRFILNASGELEWGVGGSTAPDISLSRSAANYLLLAAGDKLGLDTLQTNTSGTASAPSIIMNDADTGFFLSSANTLGIAAGGVETARLKSSASSGESSMLLITVIGGTTTLQQVGLDAVDTAGTGYRGLRVPNSAAS